MKYYLYKNNVQKTVTIHQADCTKCNHGEGYINRDKPQKSERVRDAWVGPLTKSEASVLIKHIESNNYTHKYVDCCGVYVLREAI